MHHPTIFITAPHICDVDEHRDPSCDAHTREYARMIANSVGGTLFESGVLRGVIDNNRPMSRGVTHMRRALSQALRQRHGAFLLFDIHSFTHGSDFHLRGNPDVVLLYIRGFETLTRALYAQLVRLRVRVDMVEGSTVNDIMMEAARYGGQATLVEIKQSVRIGSDTFEQITRAIQATIARTF